MVGLSDEAGAGANIGLAAKARHAPTALEAARVDEYIQETLWGVQQDIPFPVSLQDHATMGVRASLFWVPTPVSTPKAPSGASSRTTPFPTSLQGRAAMGVRASVFWVPTPVSVSASRSCSPETDASKS